MGQYDGEWHFMVDAGARNSFGGMNRTYYYAVYSEANDEYVFLDTNDKDDLGDVATYVGKVADGLDEYIKNMVAMLPPQRRWSIRIM